MLGAGVGFCSQTKEVFQFIGYVIMIFKILIPIILIVLGIIALGKAVLNSDDKEIKGAANLFIKKFIVAVVIFFIPTIVGALFNFIGGFNDVASDYKVCSDCITHPGNCK